LFSAKGGPEILRLQKYINIEAWELVIKTEYDTHSKVFVLAPTGKDLNIGGEIQIPIGNSEVRYGFKITSKFNGPLYVWVFNFNMSDLSIGRFIPVVRRRTILKSFSF